LLGAAEQHIHALWAFDESRGARSHHDIAARKAGGHDIGFATLKLSLVKTNSPLLRGLAKPNKVLSFLTWPRSKRLNHLHLRRVGRDDHEGRSAAVRANYRPQPFQGRYQGLRLKLVAE
jgi:hypothetical protein